MADIFDTVAGDSNKPAPNTAPPQGASVPSGAGYPQPLIPGNIQWYGRQRVPTDSIRRGTYGTVFSESREENGLEVLYPRIYDGSLHPSDEAWQHYKQTGQHMGKFKSAADADAYGQKYHEDAQRGLYDAAPSSQYTPGRPSGDIFDHVAAGAYDKQPSTDNKQSGFASTALNDVGQFLRGAVELPGKAVAYGIAGQPHDDVANALEQQHEAHKRAVYQQFAQDFHAGDYRKAFSGLVGLFDPKYGDPNDPLNQVMSGQWKSSAQAKNRMLEAAKQGDSLGVIQHAAGVMPIASQVDGAMETYRKEPTRENLAHVVTSALPAFIPSAMRATGKLVPAIVSKISRAGEGAEAGETPGVVQQIVKGPKVAQPGAQEAVRGAVKASAETAGAADESLAANIENQPILKGGNTVLDEQLDALEQSKKGAYKKVDDAVGFDLKAEKLQLANDRYKLSQLGNTDADITQRGNLTEAINDSTDRIAEAEGKLKKAGIDPKEADIANQRWMAGKDFRKTLVKNTNADGSIDVDGLLKDSKNLRNKVLNGRPIDRLQQFMGSEGADTFMQELQRMQELGAHAIKARKLAAIVGVPLVSTVGGALLYKAGKALAE